MPMRGRPELVVAHGDQPPGHALVAPDPHHETDSNRTPSENQAKARCEPRLRPNSDGRATNVDAGLGSPVHNVLLIPGTVMHGVASTAFCMKMANASVRDGEEEPGHAQRGQARP